jgi:hypothetical protein
MSPLPLDRPTARDALRERRAPRARAVLAMATSMACLPALPSAARADCIDEASAWHRVDARVLRAIGWQESRLRPTAVGRNRNGSVDLGAFQINSVHLADLARYGIDAGALMDGCVSAYVAAWHYRRQIDARGDNWFAVGAYHSRTPARGAWYANRIAEILMRWKVLPAQSLPFAAVATLAPRAGNEPAPPAAAGPPPEAPDVVAGAGSPRLPTTLPPAR